MGCAVISNNVAYGCDSDVSLAGLKNIYLIPVADVDAVTLGATALEHTVTAITTTGAKFVSIQARFETKDYTDEMNRENYNTKTEKTLNAVVPGMEKATLGAINELASSSKFLVIAELTNVNSAGVSKAVVIGWDKNLKKEAGLLVAANSTIETDISGIIACSLVMTGVGTEVVRRFEGTLVVEDGGSGTTVTFA